MRAGWKIAVCSAVIVGIAGVAIYAVHKIRHQITLQGAVLRADSDTDKQLPIADAEVTAISGSAVGKAKSDTSGFFRLTLSESFRRRKSVTLQFRNPNYRPLDLYDRIGKLYIVHLQPLSTPKPDERDHRPQVSISNVRVRYSVKTTSELDVGSAIRTFQVANTGNKPCSGRIPCSPDGKWKAAISSTSLDAGEGNQFRNARVSCIAGPCPFTRIENEGLADGGRVMNAVARDWSDTATFLVEAEVVHPMVSDLVRESYPVIFGQTLSFSLPALAEGPSIEAEVNGQAIVFPLGPDLYLSWAQCSLGTSKDQSKVYHCQLKPGYSFK
jgi:hypothetical protein